MMKKLCIFTLFCSALLSAAPLPMLSPAPVIDGKKGDPGWKNALTGTFKVKNGKGWLGRSATHLYVAIDVRHGNINALADTSEKQDSAVYNNDCLDFFFTPDPGSESYYQIIANVRGTIYDHFKNKDGRMNLSWDSGAVARGSYGKDSYYIELAVPLAALGCLKNRLAVAVAAFTPWNKQGEILWGSYHKPQTFTAFDIPDTFPVRVNERRWAYAGGRQSSFFTLENLSSRTLHLKGNYNGAPVAVKLNPKAIHKLECRSTLPAEKEGRNTLRLFDGKKEILYVTRTFTPIKLLKVLPMSDIIWEGEALKLKISVHEKPTADVTVEYSPGKAVCTYKGESETIHYKVIPSPWK